MKRIKASVELVIYAVTGLLFGSIFFRQIILSHFDLLLGNVGDARFNGVILEHWWQVLQGTATWLSPTFFYPVQGVLGYSDAGFLNAFFYVVLRFIGIEPFTSYQIVLFALVVVGWIGTVLFLRCCLKLRIFPTIIGAALFVFPNSMATSSGHTQLFTVYYIPFLAVGIYVLLQNFGKITSTGVITGIFLALLVPAIFYTSYYIGWFSLIYLLLLSVVCLAWSVLHSSSTDVWRCILGKREYWQRILPYCMLSAVCFIPFLLTYVPVLRLFGSRSYQEIATMLPSFIDYVNVGQYNWLWGQALCATVAGIGSGPMAWELVKGLPVFLFLTFLVLFLVYFIHTTRHYQLNVTQDGTCNIVVTGNEANDNDKLTILAVWLSLAVLLAWLLMLNIRGFSLWWLVFKLIPGAGGIRAVYRFQHILAFPIAIVIAIGLHQSINYIADHVHSYVKRGVWSGCIVVFCLLLLVEQFNTFSLANYSKQQQHEMLAGISHPPQQAKVFALLPAKGLKKLPYEAQIDAMIIAQKNVIHTINGYSAQSPPGWNGMYDIFNEPEYYFYMIRWIQQHHLENDQLCFLDLTTGNWLTGKNLRSSLQERLILMSSPLENANFAVHLSAEEVPFQWRKSEMRQCTLRVKNNGKVILSSVGNDFNNPGKYAIRLSSRWVDAGSAVPLSEFENRTSLPRMIKPSEEITMNMIINAPSKPGKYWLEIEAIQEWVAWFKDKGCPGIRINVDVR